jgi:hypothetical protein
MNKIKVLKLKNFSIYKQLLIEESLLKYDKNNWFFINEGAEREKIILGCGGKPSELVKKKIIKKR